MRDTGDGMRYTDKQIDKRMAEAGTRLDERAADLSAREWRRDLRPNLAEQAGAQHNVRCEGCGFAHPRDCSSK